MANRSPPSDGVGGCHSQKTVSGYSEGRGGGNGNGHQEQRDGDDGDDDPEARAARTFVRVLTKGHRIITLYPLRFLRPIER